MPAAVGSREDPGLALFGFTGARDESRADAQCVHGPEIEGREPWHRIDAPGPAAIHGPNDGAVRAARPRDAVARHAEATQFRGGAARHVRPLRVRHHRHQKRDQSERSERLHLEGKGELALRLTLQPSA